MYIQSVVSCTRTSDDVVDYTIHGLKSVSHSISKAWNGMSRLCITMIISLHETISIC